MPDRPVRHTPPSRRSGPPCAGRRGRDGGFGAWELALRYSYLNLNDELADGGILSDITAGTNWYVNPNTRVMLNYVHADLDDVDETSAVTVRTQIDF